MKFAAMLMVVLAMLATAVHAATKVPPRLYRVDGRPVPVSCLEELSSPDARAGKLLIDLQKCGDPTLKPRSQTDGSIGYDKPEGGYFYYFHVGQIHGLDILSLQSSGGGTGRFTTLVGVRRSGRFIRLAAIYAGGDRCNGGITNEKISNGQLTFDQAITPFDLINLAPQKLELEAYKDLEASAASCIGVVHMNGEETQWTGVSLTQTDWPDQKGWTEEYRYQSCFNQMYRNATSRGQVELSRSGVATFARSFAERCIKSR